MLWVAVLVALSAEPLARQAVEAHRAAQKTKSGWPEVRQLYDAAFAEQPALASNTDARFFYAEVLWELREYELAAPIYRDVALDPRCRYAKTAAYNQVLSYNELRKRKTPRPGEVAAVELYLQLYPTSDDAPAVAYSAVWVLHQTGQLALAEVRARELLARWPKSNEAHGAALLIAMILADERADARLLQLLRQAGPADVCGEVLSLAHTMEKEGRLSRAARLYEAAGRTDHRRELQLEAARLYTRAGELDHAEQALEGTSSEEALLLRSLLLARRNDPRATLLFLMAQPEPEPEPEREPEPEPEPETESE